MGQALLQHHEPTGKCIIFPALEECKFSKEGNAVEHVK